MDCNICMCGALAGYPHKSSCSYPLYHESEKMMLDWLDTALKLQKEAENAVSEL